MLTDSFFLQNTILGVYWIWIFYWGFPLPSKFWVWRLSSFVPTNEQKFHKLKLFGVEGKKIEECFLGKFFHPLPKLFIQESSQTIQEILNFSINFMFSSWKSLIKLGSKSFYKNWAILLSQILENFLHLLKRFSWSRIFLFGMILKLVGFRWEVATFFNFLIYFNTLFTLQLPSSAFSIPLTYIFMPPHINP